MSWRLNFASAVKTAMAIRVVAAGYRACTYLKKHNASRMVSSGMLRRVALVRTDVSEEPGASFIRV
jgi:hypothetical protein